MWRLIIRNDKQKRWANTKNTAISLPVTSSSELIAEQTYGIRITARVVEYLASEYMNSLRHRNVLPSRLAALKIIKKYAIHRLFQWNPLNIRMKMSHLSFLKLKVAWNQNLVFLKLDQNYRFLPDGNSINDQFITRNVFLNKSYRKTETNLQRSHQRTSSIRSIDLNRSTFQPQCNMSNSLECI